MTARPTRTTAAAALALAALLAHLDAAAKDPPTSCEFPTSDTPLAVTVITGPCKAPASTKAFKYNVISIQNGGNLIIDDDAGNVDIWARAILIENGGKLTIGDPARPIGTKDPKTRVTIHLYGAPTAKDSKDKKDLVFCSSTPVETCG